MINSATVIIRSVGERTEEVCRALIRAQGVTDNAIFVVREAPFSQAMRTSFRIGLDQARPWTFCIDADVLLRPGSIQRMLELAEQQPENVCEIQGYILDKFFGGPRAAGNHLYRTALLDRVLEAIPVEGADIRPEHHTLQAMEAAGFPWVLVRELVGLHDFEQSYQDIFRTCFVQAHKHSQLTSLFLAIWRAGAGSDLDYRVALAGYARGIEHHEEVHIDARSTYFEQGFNVLGISEKPAMDPSDWPLSRVEDIILRWNEPEIYRIKFPTKMGLELRPPGLAPYLGRFSNHFKTFGLGRSVPFALGWLLQRIGQRIQKAVTKP